jgi:hypothetical protein
MNVDTLYSMANLDLTNEHMVEDTSVSIHRQ